MQIDLIAKELQSQVFGIKTGKEFEKLALDIYKFQYQNVAVYKAFSDGIHRNPANVKGLSDIPFLPIEFFKTHKVLAKGFSSEIEFTSSGTTGKQTSTHYVHSLELYRESYTKSFESFYGKQENYAVLALLPSYLEREGSSLIWMVQQMIEKSKFSESGFFLNNHKDLADMLKYFSVVSKDIILFGVTFALLDFIEKYSIYIPQLKIVETGGMKGRRKEMVREEVHAKLQSGFGVDSVHSEYGMTELLSQAWSLGDGVFQCPPWMKVLIRETNDPLTLSEKGKSGGINVIDFANLYSCSFIATQDLGKLHSNDSFEVLGRFDQSDIRGCNLLVL
ncbi:MAG: acyltransferase [Bacteroidales bacterium]